MRRFTFGHGLMYIPMIVLTAAIGIWGLVSHWVWVPALGVAISCWIIGLLIRSSGE